MSKNMTRRGLALGAGFSLVASLMAAAPAAAANPETLTLAPSAGTGNSTLSHSTFTLQATIDPSIATGNFTNLRYRVENPQEEDVTFEVKRGATAGANTAHDYGDADGVANKVGDQSLNSTSAADYTTATDVLNLTVAGNLAVAGQSVTITGLDGTVDDTAVAADADAQAEWAKVIAAVNGNTFVLQAGTNATTLVIDLGAGGTADTDFAAGDFSADDNGTVPTATAVSANANTETTDDPDFVVEPETGTNDAATGNAATLELSVAQNAKDTPLTVTAWLDINGDNTISDGEPISSSETITFKQVSKLVGAATLVQPVIGATSLTATIGFQTAGINVRQIDTADVVVTFDGPNDGAHDGNGTVAYSTALGALVATKSIAGDDADASETFTAQLKLANGDDGDGNVDDAEGALSSKATSAVTADTFRVELSDKTGVITTAKADKETSTQDSDVYADNQAGTAKVRIVAGDSTSFTVKGFVGTDAATPAAVKSATVQVATTPGADLTAADGLTINGKAVTTVADADTAFNLTTDSSGNWSFDVTGAAMDEADTLAVQVTVQGVSSQTLTIAFDASDYDLHDVTDVTGVNERTIVEGASASMTFQMVDQWGLAPADGLYRITAIDQANNRTTKDADFTVSEDVVGGKATLTITDNGEGTGTTTVRTAYGKFDAALSADASDLVDTVLNVVADATVSAFDMSDLAYGSAQANDANADGDFADAGDTDNRKKLILETKTFGDYDANFALPGASAPTLTANNKVTIAGKIENAAGTGVAGSVLTMTAAGMQFQAGSVYAVGEITFAADADGDFTVDVWSRIGGTRTVSITSGGVTETVDLTYAAGGSDASSALSVATVSQITPGTTTNVIATVTDEFGNAVQGATVRFSTTLGYMAQADVTSDANGVAIGKLITAPNDKGTAELTVSVPANTDIVAVSQSVGVGQAAASADQKVNAGSFKGYVAVYARGYEGQRLSAKVGNDWVIVDPIVNNQGGDLHRTVEFTGAGVDIAVRIYIDRVLVDTINLTTK